MEMQTALPEVIVEREGAIGRLRLNRPRALNSLNLAMIRAIDAALTEFERDPAIAAVLITGEGERGLCAGGDIRMIYESGRERPEEGAQFWREEFIVNSRISAYAKPYIAIMDGIVMGGGSAFPPMAVTGSSPRGRASPCRKRASAISPISVRPGSCRARRASSAPIWA